MRTQHRNKTLATLLASATGSIGLHRFYLYGRKDWLAWLHLACLPVSVIGILLFSNAPPLFAGILFVLSVLAGMLQALSIGLTPDEKWDARHNPDSGRHSSSHWILALLLVLTLGVGATGVIALMARSFDLLYTGGAYG